METILHKLYNSAHEAEQAAEQLMAAGIGAHAIHLIAPNAGDHAGSFADTGAHMHSAERDHAGSFADTSAHMHSAERDRVGSFASVEPPRGRMSDLASELTALGIEMADAADYAARLNKGAALLVARIDPAMVAPAAEILGLR